eukprot:EG_transcript_3607
MGSTTLWARIRYNLAHSPSSPSARVGLSIVPDTVDAGARPSYWNVTVENINYVAPHWFNIISFSTSKDVFRSLGSGSADIDMAGCNASVSSGYSTSVLLTLDDNCGVGGTFSFIVPGSYFTVNPGGLVTVTLRIGSDTLRTNITYTRAPTLTIVPDSVEPGALASSWRVTVENAGYLDPTSGSTYLSFDTNRSAFSNSNGRYPDVAVGGCTATRSPFFFTDTALTFSLSPGCTLGGTFSFLLPGEYLASNPGGPMAVKLTFGWTTLRTTVVYAGPAVFSVVPETVEPGAQAAHWSVTATDLAPVAPRPLQYIYLATCCGKTVFVARSTATPFGIVGGCATTSTATFSTLLIYLPDDCGLRGGTLSFAIPGKYLAPNPAGNVSLYLTVGSNALSSSIAYEGSRSPGNNPNQPMLLSVAPATAVAGAQAAYWRVTVVNLDPVAPGQSRVFYLATSTAAFQRHPAATPLLSVAGCSASATSTLTTALYFTLASDCGYGGTFSFQVPGDYLAPNPTGDVSVTLSIGVNVLKSVIVFTGPSPSPLHDSTLNPAVLPSPAPVSRSKESTADITNSDLLLMILVGAILCVLVLLLVLAVLVYHFIRHTHPVGDERYLLTTSGRLLVPVATGVEFLTSGCFANCPAVGIPTGSTSV